MGLLKDTKKAADGMLKPKSKGKKKPPGDAWRLTDKPKKRRRK